MSAVVGGSARALFADLVHEATADLDTPASPMAIGYVVDLLEARLRSPSGTQETQALGEALLRARGAAGAARIPALRSVGDASLFVAGFFGDSLWRRGLSDSYYEQIGCSAYASLASALGDGSDRAGWPELFDELAGSFSHLVELLGEVGDRTRSRDCGDALRIYSHYLETGSRRDRSRLLRRGIVPVAGGSWSEPQ